VGFYLIVDALGHGQVLIQNVIFISKILFINVPGVLHGLLAGYQLECLLHRACL